MQIPSVEIKQLSPELGSSSNTSLAGDHTHGPELPRLQEGSMSSEDGFMSENDSESFETTAANTLASPATSWKWWSSEQLTRLVAKAKGAASEAALAFIKSSMSGTKLIFVMGQSGTGKTSILRELTGLDLHVGKELKSGTLQYYVCPAVIDEEQYLFIDTAGFGAADLSDEGTFQDIMNCLLTLRPFVTIAGVLFVYGPINDRLSGQDQRTLRWIECFCGPQFFSNITIVTTKWDRWNQDSFEDEWVKIELFKKDSDVNHILNPSGRYHGGTIYHHGLPGGTITKDSCSLVLSAKSRAAERGDEIRDLIRRRYANKEIPELQIVRELDQGISLSKTQAAKVLVSDIQKTLVKLSEGSANLVSLDGLRLISDSEASSAPPKESANLGPNPPKPGTDKSENQPKAQPKKQATWYERIFPWLVIIQETAEFFAEARTSGYQSGNKAGGKPAPTWNIWEKVQKWWTGSV